MKLLLQNKIIASDALPTNADRLKWSVWNDYIDVSEDRLVIFNTLTRNAVVISHSPLHAEIDALDTEQRDTLCRLGFIVDALKDEKNEWEQSYISGKEDLSYIDLTILLTQDCQMRCVYCFEGDKNKSSITDTTIDAILQFLHRQVDSCSKVRVTWFGGEPLLAYDKLKDMSIALIDFCKANGIEYSADITTNGLALNPKRCHELITDLNVRRYIITVDGPAEIHEQRRPLASRKAYFPLLWRNITTLVEEGAGVSIRMTIDKKNATHIPALLDTIASSQLRNRVGLAFCRTIDYNYTPEAVSEYIYTEAEFADVEWQLIQYAHRLGLWRYRFPHAAPTGGCLRRGDIVVGVNGEIYKCLDTVGDTKWISGHIADDLEHQSKPDWFEEWDQWTPLKDSHCRACVLAPLCNGGCPHNSLFTDKQHGSATGCPDWKPNYRRQIKSLVAEFYDNETI